MSGTSGISSGRGGTPSSGVGGIRLMRGCMDLGRSISPEKASSISVRSPNPPKPAEIGGAGDSSRSDPESCDMDRKYSDRPWIIRGLSAVRGGSRLTRFPSLLVVSWSCRASSRLCKAKASKGDSSGGASPATWRRGDRRGREEVDTAELTEWDRKSNKDGRLVTESFMLPEAQIQRVC